MQCQDHLPPEATLKKVLTTYYEQKAFEMDKMGDMFKSRFVDRLRHIEQAIMHGTSLRIDQEGPFAPPVSREQD